MNNGHALHQMRQFETGATRDTAEGKPSFASFLSPKVIRRFGQYMLENQHLPDGTKRKPDNWQLGMPMDAYMESAWRHFLDVWEGHRDGNENVEAMCALLFNIQGMMHEVLKKQACQNQRQDLT